MKSAAHSASSPTVTPDGLVMPTGRLPHHDSDWRELRLRIYPGEPVECHRDPSPYLRKDR